MAKKAVGRTKLAAKHARKAAGEKEPLQEESAPVPTVSKEVSKKTKQKVNKKIQFLDRVEKSAAASIKKTKKERKKTAPLPDLKGLSQVLEDLLPEIKSQEEKAATLRGTKYKKATARKKLQQNEQDRLAAIFCTTDFQKDPIGAVGNFLQRTLEPDAKQLALAAANLKEAAQSKTKKRVQR